MPAAPHSARKTFTRANFFFSSLRDPSDAECLNTVHTSSMTLSQGETGIIYTVTFDSGMLLVMKLICTNQLIVNELSGWESNCLPKYMYLQP